MKNSVCINVFRNENGLGFPIYLWYQKFENTVNLLLLIDDDNQWRNWIRSSLIQFRRKTVVNERFSLESSFEYILHMTDVLINNGSGWNVELTESQYINISIYRPLSRSFYIKLLVELRSPKKEVVNIEKKEQRYFFWWHVRNINLSKKHPGRIKKVMKNFVEKFNHDVFEFLMQGKGFHKTEVKNSKRINVFWWWRWVGFSYLFFR